MKQKCQIGRLLIIKLHSMNTILKLKEDLKPSYVIGASAIAALMAFYAVYKINKSSKTPTIEDSDSEIHEINDRILYEENVTDKHQFSFANYPIERNTNISDIVYRIILNFNKGNIYQGVVKMSFFIKSLKRYETNFKLNFNGSSVKFLSVNGRVLEASEIVYDNHGVFFDKSYLNEKKVNKIEIIFENKYSFLDDGLASYFILDDSNKYSLKEQVIYAKNGPYEVERMIPCLNNLNECKVDLQIIYPQGFQSFSNNPKSLDRPCTAQQYPQYSFFFNVPERGLNKSFKLNESFTGSNFDNSTLNSSAPTKRNSHFYTANLLSIHNLFAFCSNVAEIPNPTGGLSNEMKILIRYFGKSNKVEKLARHVSTLDRHIIDVCNRLAEFKIEKLLTKIDVFFVADREIHGYYVPGAIILDEESLNNGVHIKTFYLVARAIYGMIREVDYKGHFQLEKMPQNSPFRNPLSLEVSLDLNQKVCEKFPQCKAYVFFKQQDIQKARGFLKKKEFLQKNSLRFKQYYYKETPFMLSDNALNSLYQKLPFQYKDIDTRLKGDTITFWKHFMTQYNFLSPYIAELVLKIAINHKGIPFENPQIIDFAKKNFTKSKHYLSFFTNEEIQNNLPHFLQGKFHQLEERLTQIKIKQKFRDYISNQYESYLPIKSNRQQVKTIYEQFKRFKENRNFHHISVLKHEIKRIKMFGQDFISRQGLNLQCGFMSWKLLSKIKIYPSNPDYKKVIYELEQEPLESEKNGQKIKKKKQFSE